jgi:predicted nucleic acid-binding protein
LSQALGVAPGAVRSNGLKKLAGTWTEAELAKFESDTALPTNDIWIAAVCAREGATVLSYDAHFSAIGRVGSQILSRD